MFGLLPNALVPPKEVVVPVELPNPEVGAVDPNDGAAVLPKAFPGAAPPKLGAPVDCVLPKAGAAVEEPKAFVVLLPKALLVVEAPNAFDPAC